MTQDHCSFCDGHPMALKLFPTIEYFKPKSSYPELACIWTNLYTCCMYCQQKESKYSDLLLRPDAQGYSFKRYFIYDYNKHLLETNSTASESDQERVIVTIKIYRLNTPQKQAAREAELKAFEQSNNNDINNFAYRYMYT